MWRDPQPECFKIIFVVFFYHMIPIHNPNQLPIVLNSVIRPGRLDRLIHVPLPNEQARGEIFKIHTQNMNIEKFDLKNTIKEMNDFSGAEIKAVATEAGY